MRQKGGVIRRVERWLAVYDEKHFQKMSLRGFVGMVAVALAFVALLHATGLPLSPSSEVARSAGIVGAVALGSMALIMMFMYAPMQADIVGMLAMAFGLIALMHAQTGFVFLAGAGLITGSVLLGIANTSSWARYRSAAVH